jgi:hypothetical protein
MDGNSESGSEENGKLGLDGSGAAELASENEFECSLCYENGLDVCTCLSIGF